MFVGDVPLLTLSLLEDALLEEGEEGKPRSLSLCVRARSTRMSGLSEGFFRSSSMSIVKPSISVPEVEYNRVAENR